MGREGETESVQRGGNLSDDVCHKCRGPINLVDFWHILHGSAEFSFCSRRCMVEFVAPELAQAVVIKQWMPTPEDEKRMCE